MRILVCGSQSRTKTVCALLGEKNSAVDLADNDRDCISFSHLDIYDVLIICVPRAADGASLVRSLRAGGCCAPVLMIGENNDIADVVRGLNDGADDYLFSPFAAEEFIARVQALSRRKLAKLEYDTLSFGDIVLDLNKNELLCGGRPIHLGVKEFQIMKLLISNGPNIIPKEQLTVRIWGLDSEAEYNNAEVYISFLRKKLRQLGSNVSIRTLRGLGYCLMKK